VKVYQAGILLVYIVTKICKWALKVDIALEDKGLVYVCSHLLTIQPAPVMSCMKSKLPLCKVLLVRYPVMKELLVIPKLARLFAGSWEGIRARCITTIKVHTYQLGYAP